MNSFNAHNINRDKFEKLWKIAKENPDLFEARLKVNREGSFFWINLSLNQHRLKNDHPIPLDLAFFPSDVPTENEPPKRAWEA